jgi:hypothetical protein
MKKLALLTLAMMMTATLVGCNGQTTEERLTEAAHENFEDMLVTPAEDEMEYENQVARTEILNERAIEAEWRRIWLMNRPSRSLYYPYP